ncbi:MAG: alpha/beta fold hydrolase [Asgard group archaeon]|nr:alpha/beta fold hydrolase [Asgard group archaeon]
MNQEENTLSSNLNKKKNKKPSLKEIIQAITSPYLDMLSWINSFTFNFARRDANASFSNSPVMEPILALLDNLSPEKVVRNIRDKAGPFFYKGNDIGVLIVHGFSSTAQETQELGIYLNEEAGYSTFCVLLAGHGTSPADLAQTTIIDWYKSLKEGYTLLRQYCQKIFVIGHSMGGTLSLLLAANEEIDGIVCLCTPIKVEYFMQDYLYLVKDLLRYFPRRKEEIELMDKNNLINYRVSSLRAVDNMLDLMEVAIEEIPKVTAPIFTITAGKDERVPLYNAQKILQLVQSDIKRDYFAEHSIHTILFGEEKNLIMQKILDFLLFLDNNN